MPMQKTAIACMEKNWNASFEESAWSVMAVREVARLIADVDVGEAAAVIVLAESVAADQEHRHLEDEQSRPADRKRPEKEVHDSLHLDATRDIRAGVPRVSSVRASQACGRALAASGGRRPGSQIKSVVQTSEPERTDDRRDRRRS